MQRLKRSSALEPVGVPGFGAGCAAVRVSFCAVSRYQTRAPALSPPAGSPEQGGAELLLAGLLLIPRLSLSAPTTSRSHLRSSILGNLSRPSAGEQLFEWHHRLWGGTWPGRWGQGTRHPREQTELPLRALPPRAQCHPEPATSCPCASRSVTDSPDNKEVLPESSCLGRKIVPPGPAAPVVLLFSTHRFTSRWPLSSN